jgi:Tfp pilus assembly protein PilX
MILAVVLVALLVVMLIGAALANAFLAERQLARHHQQQQQAFWLADSALHRAAHRFANEPGYEGETWQVSADDLGGTHTGVAVVRVETVSEPEPGHRIIVDASYPSGALKKTVQHRELIVAQPTE